MSAMSKACTCRTPRTMSAVELAPCEWHLAYRRARRALNPRLGPDEISRIRREAWARRREGLAARVATLEAQVASLQMSAPRGIP